MVRRAWTLAFVLMVLAGLSGRAHHSFGAVYLESDSIEVEGAIVEFQFKNPHAWVHVRGVERGTGAEKVFAAEWVSTSQLERAGIDKTTLRPGDVVRMWGAPSRNPSEARLHLKRIQRSDGWAWQGRRQQPDR